MTPARVVLHLASMLVATVGLLVLAFKNGDALVTRSDLASAGLCVILAVHSLPHLDDVPLFRPRKPGDKK